MTTSKLSKLTLLALEEIRTRREDITTTTDDATLLDKFEKFTQCASSYALKEYTLPKKERGEVLRLLRERGNAKGTACVLGNNHLAFTTMCGGHHVVIPLGRVKLYAFQDTEFTCCQHVVSRSTYRQILGLLHNPMYTE